MNVGGDATAARRDGTQEAGAELSEQQMKDDASALVVRWGTGLQLVPQLCSVHPVKLSLWRGLQYMPSLVYRLQVRPACFLCIQGLVC